MTLEELYGLLFRSCKENDINLTKDILIREKSRIDINHQFRHDGSLLYVACYHDKLELVEYILKVFGGTIDVNITTSSYSSHPLHPAAWNGNTRMVGCLLDAGGKINCQDRSHLTPIGYAAANGHFETAKLLVVRNADLHMELEDNETALDFATKGNHDDIVKLLIESGAEVRAQNRYYES